MNKNKNKKWSISCLFGIGILLVAFGSITVYMDPFFHYHKPQEGVSYTLDANERYKNDGILKHFNYDAIIAGTSMIGNFKTTEFDDEFGVNSIKVGFSGGGYKEIGSALSRVNYYENDVKMVLWGLDTGFILYDKDWSNYSGIPYYLYDNNPFNDVSYVFNKSILLNETYQMIVNTKLGLPSTTFDNYGFWGTYYSKDNYGLEGIEYLRPEKTGDNISLSDEERTIVFENITQNVESVVKKYPNIKFKLFYTPYSILYWDSINQAGKINWQFEAMEIATSILTKYDNVELYCFFNEHEVIENLDNYKDSGHYGGWINSEILKWIKDEKYLLTKDNYTDYFNKMKKYYLNYNYDAIFK